MPWFNCDDCGDTLKKAKVAQHSRQCSASSFTCIDCSRTFDARGTAAHTSCVTEHEKYALGVTKPGGYAADGNYAEGGQANASKAPPAPPAAAVDRFLATRPPWTCSICNTTCTSRSTLEGHAAGTKHIRRVRASLRAEAEEAAKKEADKGEAVGPESEAAAASAAAPATPIREPEEREPVDAGSPAAPTPADGSSKKRKVAGADGGPDVPVTAKGKPLKWRKLATVEIEGAGGEAPLSQVAAKLAELAAEPEAAKRAIVRLLEGSGKFTVEGGAVRRKA